MLKLINGILVIAAVGVLMGLIFMIGQAQAHQQAIMDAVMDRWYLLAAFVLAVIGALITNRKPRQT